MAMHNNLSEIEARCTEIINSPYMRRELPPELLKLRVLLNKVEKLTREDVPSMIGEIKRLRSQNKRLEAEAEASHEALSSDSLDPLEVESIERTELSPLDQNHEHDHEHDHDHNHEELIEAAADGKS